ncbi:MAG: hypothetical protein M3Y60_05890, partial [Bacteroidota bacterium]|nr:hypothetical protein [Bacteroidota bacterium]
ANGLIGGTDRERSLGLPADKIRSFITGTSAPDGYKGPAYQLKTPGGEKILFVPYFEADGRDSGTWRLTWLQNGIDQESDGE